LISSSLPRRRRDYSPAVTPGCERVHRVVDPAGEVSIDVAG
jgi:hypothetical protein